MDDGVYSFCNSLLSLDTLLVEVHWDPPWLMNTNTVALITRPVLGLRCSLLPVELVHSSSEYWNDFEGEIPCSVVKNRASNQKIYCTIDTAMDCDAIQDGIKVFCIPFFTLKQIPKELRLTGIIVSMTRCGSQTMFYRIGQFCSIEAIIFDVFSPSPTEADPDPPAVPTTGPAMYERLVKLRLQHLFQISLETRYEGVDTVVEDGLVQHNIILN